MAAGEDERQPTLEAPSFGERVLWRPGRALVIGNPERCRELLEGLAVFAWHEGHLRRLEGETAAAWGTGPGRCRTDPATAPPPAAPGTCEPAGATHYTLAHGLCPPGVAPGEAAAVH